MDIDGSAWAKIELSLGNIDKHLQEEKEMRRRAQMSMQPALFTIPIAKVAPGASFTIGSQSGQISPPQGFNWYLRDIMVADLGASLASAITWSAFVVVTGMNLDGVTAVPYETIRDNLTPSATASTYANPVTKQYSNEQLTVKPGENIGIFVVGATTGHQFVASLNGIAIQDAAHGQGYSF